MSRHITDHSHMAASAQRTVRYAETERRKHPHPAIKTLAAAPRAAGQGRIKAYTKIERQTKD